MPNHQKWDNNFKNGRREFNFTQEISVLNKSYLCQAISISSQCPRHINQAAVYNYNAQQSQLSLVHSIPAESYPLH
jgi:hypothetical protein